MSSFSTSMYACTHMWVGMCAPLGSSLHLYIHALYADFFLIVLNMAMLLLG